MIRRERILFRASALFLAIFAICVVFMTVDTRQVTGVSAWLKPAKFAISIAIYLATLGAILSQVHSGHPAFPIIRKGAVLTMAGEMAIIVYQAGRGVRSHFNTDTRLDEMLFGAMGLLIVANTILAARLAWVFWSLRIPAMPEALLAGIRWGLVIFVIGSLEGFLMVSRRAHSIGQPDGGPGLPFLNWSNRAGDLRVAHFFALHALQALPLAGLLTGSRRTVLALALAWALVAGWLLVQALAGKPLTPGPN